MAGYTDFAFRQVLCKCGASVTWTEMISATALYHNSERTKAMLKSSGKTIVQLFGKIPEHFVSVIKSGILDKFVEININMGCPARKITSNGDGCCLMKNPDLAREIITACVVSTKKPVSVKLRLGFDKNTAIEFAKMCESAGANRIIMHGRLGIQGYSGTADWNAIADVVKSVNIPVIANGDIKSLADAEKCISITKAAGVMMGRALVGNPWNISNKKVNKKAIIIHHINNTENILEFRKHLLAYASNFPNAKTLKNQLCTVSSRDEALDILSSITPLG